MLLSEFVFTKSVNDIRSHNLVLNSFYMKIQDRCYGKNQGIWMDYLATASKAYLKLRSAQHI